MGQKFEQKRNEVTFQYNLDQCETWTNYITYPQRFAGMRVGADRWENAMMGDGVYRRIRVNGLAKFRWVCNRSGNTLTRGTLVSFKRATWTATSGSTSTVVAAVGSFVEDENLWDNLIVLQDAGGAGAAPEGEAGIIVKAKLNTAETHITFTCRTPAASGLFSAAPAAGDTGVIRSRYNIIPITATDGIEQFAGVVVREDGIPDNSFGWVCYEADEIEIKLKAGTGVTANLGFMAADDADGSTIAKARIINSTGTDLVGGKVLGTVLETIANDIAADVAWCRLKAVGADEA